jgi:hypothetical protein
MKTLSLIAMTAAGLTLAGCSTVFEGTSQEITVITNPPGANCALEREGLPITTVTTPGTVLVRKSKCDITVKCNKPGFEEAQYLNNSGTSAYIAGNIAADILLTAGISSIVDSASGADNKYDPIVNLSLVPIQQTQNAAGITNISTNAAAAALSQRPSLGIIGSTVTRQSSGPAINLADPYGAFVTGVAPRSAAAEAGIQQGDIIRTFSGRRVSTFEELDAFAAETVPGSHVILGVYRNRQIVDVEVTF